MPRLRVIITDKSRDDPNTFNCLFWADVPAGRQAHYADPNSPPTKVSAWIGATAADNTALQNGSMVEQPGQARHDAGTPITTVEAFLQQRWQDYQNYITNFNPWQREGSTWDGTTWDIKNNP